MALVGAGWHLPLVVDSFRSLGLTAIGWLLGPYAGPLVLTWLHAARGRSVFLLALCHTSYNFTSATAATGGLSAALTSTLVMVVAMVVVVACRRGPPIQGAADRARTGLFSESCRERTGADRSTG